MGDFLYRAKQLRHKFAKFSEKREGFPAVLASAVLLTSVTSGGLWLGMDDPQNTLPQNTVMAQQENNTSLAGLSAQQDLQNPDTAATEPVPQKDPRKCALKAGSVIIFLFALLASIPLADSRRLEKWAKEKPKKPPRFRH